MCSFSSFVIYMFVIELCSDFFMSDFVSLFVYYFPSLVLSFGVLFLTLVRYLCTCFFLYLVRSFCLSFFMYLRLSSLLLFVVGSFFLYVFLFVLFIYVFMVSFVIDFVRSLLFLYVCRYFFSFFILLYSCFI